MYLANLRRSLRAARRSLSLVALALLAATSTLLAEDNINASTIFVQGKAIFLFTWGADPCENGPSNTMTQLLVSTDSGRSWQKSGPRMGGYEFDFLFEKDGKIWIAGQHVMEGPETDPFIFIPTESPTRWEVRTIYHGNGGLNRIAWGDTGDLIAWVSHLQMSGQPTSNGWEGPTYIHQSLDNGLTWKVLGEARKLKVKKGIEFTNLDHLKKNPLWRISKSKDGGFRVLHRDTQEAPWKQVSRFVHHRCAPPG